MYICRNQVLCLLWPFKDLTMAHMRPFKLFLDHPLSFSTQGQESQGPSAQRDVLLRTSNAVQYVRVCGRVYGYTYMHMEIYICTDVHVCVCLNMNMCIHMQINAYARTHSQPLSLSASLSFCVPFCFTTEAMPLYAALCTCVELEQKAFKAKAHYSEQSCMELPQKVLMDR